VKNGATPMVQIQLELTGGGCFDAFARSRYEPAAAREWRVDYTAASAAERKRRSSKEAKVSSVDCPSTPHV
jgi:hypothetical protein